jgi:hypothetical protein
MTDLWDGPQAPKKSNKEGLELAVAFNKACRKSLFTDMITTGVVLAGTIAAGIYGPLLLDTAIITLGMSAKMFINRNKTVALKHAFNDLMDQYDAQTRQLLHPLEKELQDIEPINFENSNPVALFKKDPVTTLIAGAFCGLAPLYAIGVYAYAVNSQDSKKYAQLVNASIQSADNLIKNSGPENPPDQNPSP